MKNLVVLATADGHQFLYETNLDGRKICIALNPRTSAIYNQEVLPEFQDLPHAREYEFSGEVVRVYREKL